MLIFYVRIDREIFSSSFSFNFSFFLFSSWVQARITLKGDRYLSGKAHPPHVSKPNVTIGFSQPPGCFFKQDGGVPTNFPISTATSPYSFTCKHIFFLIVRLGTRNMR